MKKTIYLIFLSVLFLGVYSTTRGQCTKVTTLTNITMESGSCIHSINGYDFLMEADANGTSSLIDRNTSNHVTHATGSESVDEIYVTEDTWHYISSPMQDEKSGAFLDMYLYDWDEPTQTWHWNSPVYIPLTPMQGWALWSPNSTGSTTRTYKGDFNTGGQSFSLTNQQGACPIGANLVGNPYPSSLNWESNDWTLTNVGPTIYLWNSTTGNTGTYNRSTDVSTNGIDSIIPPKQGFFVKVTNGNSTGDIAVGNNARIHCLNRPVYKAQKNEKPFVLQMFVTSGLTTYSDEALIVFNKEASNNFDDEYDAFKIKGQLTAPQLYTDWYGTQYTVNTLTEMEEDMSIPLNFEAGIDGIYTLNINSGNFPANTELYLEDKKLDKWQDLQANPVYGFAANTEDKADRFLLHFGAPNQVDELSNAGEINVYSFKKDIHIQTPQGFRGEVKVYDMLGQEIAAQSIYNEETVITMISPADYYIVKVISNYISQNVSTHKIFIK
jgi:hypothetical protein